MICQMTGKEKLQNNATLILIWPHFPHILHFRKRTIMLEYFSCWGKKVLVQVPKAIIRLTMKTEYFYN